MPVGITQKAGESYPFCVHVFKQRDSQEKPIVLYPGLLRVCADSKFVQDQLSGGSVRRGKLSVHLGENHSAKSEKGKTALALKGLQQIARSSKGPAQQPQMNGIIGSRSKDHPTGKIVAGKHIIRLFLYMHEGQRHGMHKPPGPKGFLIADAMNYLCEIETRLVRQPPGTSDIVP